MDVGKPEVSHTPSSSSVPKGNSLSDPKNLLTPFIVSNQPRQTLPRRSGILKSRGWQFCCLLWRTTVDGAFDVIVVGVANRTDAEKLARYARLDPRILRPITYRTVEQQQALTMIRARDVLVRLLIESRLIVSRLAQTHLTAIKR
jgi:hypothetical protein